MKKYFPFFILIAFCADAKAQSQTISDTIAIMTFDSTTYDFGTITEGSTIQKDFHFTNKGHANLFVNGSKAAGNVTMPILPIAPNGKGVIGYQYNTEGISGRFDRSFTVYSNNRNGPIVLRVIGNIIPDPNAPIMTFDSTTFHFGTVTQGKIIEHDFIFKNTGKTPLIIRDGNTSCGCDVVSYPKEPIAPGKSGVIHYRLNTEGKMGMQEKTATLTTNMNDQVIVLHTKGNVILPTNGN